MTISFHQLLKVPLLSRKNGKMPKNQGRRAFCAKWHKLVLKFGNNLIILAESKKKRRTNSVTLHNKWSWGSSKRHCLCMMQNIYLTIILGTMTNITSKISSRYKRYIVFVCYCGSQNYAQQLCS